VDYLRTDLAQKTSMTLSEEMAKPVLEHLIHKGRQASSSAMPTNEYQCGELLNVSLCGLAYGQVQLHWYLS
jgi:hypothetical protein